MRAIKCGFVELAMAVNDPEFGRELPEGLDGLADLSAISGRPVCLLTITQPDSAPPDHWRRQLERLEQQIAAGRDFFALGNVDQSFFEMTFENTNQFDRWPTWQKVLFLPLPERKAQMGDPAVRAQLRTEMLNNPLPGFNLDWPQIRLVESPTGRWRQFEGKTVTEIAAALGKDPLETAFDIALDEDLKTHFRIRGARFADKEPIVEILKSPHIVPGMSDAGAHMVSQIETGFPTHLLGYWVRERGALSLEAAVQLLASRPADIAGVTDRGRLLPGQAADIVLFDPKTIHDGARDFANDLPGGGKRLIQHAHGIEAVFVNGVLTRQDGHETGDLGGRVLRSGWYKKS